MADAKTSALTSYSNPDAVNDVIPIVDNTNSTLKKISRNNLLGITSAPVGKDDTQTLTAKTLTAPTIASPVLSGTITGTYTLAGTPTFPSSVTTLTGSQTLTNKILTSPTINAPTITNASITQDAVTGFTNANNGTLYGIAVTSSVFTTNNIVPNNSLSNTGSFGSAWAWTSTVPTFTNFTIGNGTVTARYAQVGKTIVYRGQVTLGSTSSMGTSPTLTLPVTANSTGYTASMNQSMGQGTYQRNGVGFYLIDYTFSSTTTAAMFAHGVSTYVIFSGVTATVPNTWASTDTLTWNIVYEAA